jgi:methyl-accepting chemotaxis protein
MEIGGYDMHWFANRSLRWKLLGGFGLVLLLVGGAGAWSAYQYRATDRAYRDVLEGEKEGAVTAQRMRATFGLQIQALKNTWLRGADAEQFTKYAGEFDARAADMRAHRVHMEQIAPHLTADELALLQKFDTGWAGYVDAWPKAKDAFGGPGGGKVKDGDAVMKGKDRDANEALDGLAASLDGRTAALSASLAAETARTLKLAAAALFAALMLGLTVAWMLVRSIVSGLRQMTAAADNIAAGALDVDVSLNRGDEVGQLAGSFRAMTGSLREKAAIADAIANGDLSRDFAATSERDVLGHAFERMIVNTRDLVSRVQTAATGLAATSVQLSAAAGQTSGAVQQVAGAVSGIAAGAQESSSSAQNAGAGVEHLARAVSGIARGAEQQSEQARAATATAERMASGVEQVAVRAAAVLDAGAQTRTAAEDGARAVHTAGAGMASLAEVVNHASARVQDLGRLGEQIGTVVETIDDIAEQTNLLALNAAIEAARAGEHGRGFAVVADEVRKLAERSQRETRAISQLIEQVQDGTRRAVEAMKSGAAQVETGTATAQDAAASLDQILAAVDATVNQVDGIATAARSMAVEARQVVGSLVAVSGVIEENTSAAVEMAAQAVQVSEAVDAIAAIAEENSAATEETSAAAEEMTAQVEEMTAQAEQLAATAVHLQQLVARFVLTSDGASEIDNPVELQPAA